jgi:hypothetical protein
MVSRQTPAVGTSASMISTDLQLAKQFTSTVQVPTWCWCKAVHSCMHLIDELSSVRLAPADYWVVLYTLSFLLPLFISGMFKA